MTIRLFLTTLCQDSRETRRATSKLCCASHSTSADIGRRNTKVPVWKAMARETSGRRRAVLRKSLTPYVHRASIVALFLTFSSPRASIVAPFLTFSSPRASIVALFNISVKSISTLLKYILLHAFSEKSFANKV